MFRSLRSRSRSSLTPTLRLRAVATVFGAALAASGFLLPQVAQAQSCPMPTAEDFRIDTLANNATNDLYGGVESGNYGVVQIAVAPNGKVFIAKMCSGEIRVYRPGAGGADTPTLHAGTVPTHCDNEDGLLGVVLDRNFASNGWLYVFHAGADYATAPANADSG